MTVRRLVAFAIPALLILPAVPAGAQRFAFEAGLRAAFPVDRDRTEPEFTGGFSTFLRPAYTIGPTFSIVGDDRLALTVEGLYTPVRIEGTSPSPNSTGFEAVRAHAIDVPVLGSYRFDAGPARAFAGAGLVVFRRLWGRHESRRVFTDGTGRVTNVVRPYRASPDGPPPFVIFSGMAFDGSRIAVRPEFRYTRRADDPVRPVNQFEIAVTVSFDVVRFEGGGG